MDHLENTTKHQKYKHLSLEDRVIIQIRLKDGWTAPRIAEAIGCCSNTVRNEIKRGSRPMYKNKRLCYRANTGHENYVENRKSCHRKYKILSCSKFIDHVMKMFKGPNKWSFDAITGEAATVGRFPKPHMVCTKTLYNYADLGLIAIKNFDLPEKAMRNTKTARTSKNKKILGTSIDQRPDAIEERQEFGHWEIDTVIGKKTGKHSVLLTLVERLTDKYITHKIPGKDASSVKIGLEKILAEYGEKVVEIFKTITSDNGSEFADLAVDANELLAADVYFAHPYTSCERPINERHNRMVRRFIPKGKDIDNYSVDDIAFVEDWMNGLPRKRLGYRTPEELFDEQLDRIYTA